MKRLALCASFLLLCGCQLDYLAHSAYNQSKILHARKPIEKVLEDASVNEETKRKLRLILEVKKFGEEKLGLKTDRNYMSYVALDRDYVSYVLQVAPMNELTHYEWSYPIVGKMPYKGYFNKDLAKEEANKFPADKWDTYVRGVSAYSTLGWFHDPVLSSMLRYADHELVDTILHETVHANIYIKNHADFNERLAMFLGGVGMREFYAQKEGTNSKTLKEVADDKSDDKAFSEFISRELDTLKKWYADHKTFSADEKKARLAEIQTRFKEILKPKLKSNSYVNFSQLKLNNALLLTYQTYLYDLSDFEKVFAKKSHDYRAFLEFCKSLEKADDPEKALKAAAA